VAYGYPQSVIGSLVHGVRQAIGFAAEQKHLVFLEGVVEIGTLSRGGEHDQTQPLRSPPRLEKLERTVAGERNLIEVIHAGAPEGAVRNWEPGRLNDMRRNAQAGAEPQNCTGVLGNIRLIEGDLYWPPVKIRLALRRNPLQTNDSCK